MGATTSSDDPLDRPRPDSDDLSEAEARMWRQVVAGVVDEDYRAGNPVVDEPRRGAEWGPERQLRASVLIEVLLDADQSNANRLRRFRVQGARITGQLDLEAASMPFPLALVNCSFECPVNFCEASAHSLTLDGSCLPSLDARQIATRGDLRLGEGFEAEGEVNLLGAHIGGTLECDGGKFRNAGGYAINAGRIEVAGNVSMGHGFEAEGEVNLLGAHIGSWLVCDGGKFRNVEGRALNAEGLRVEGTLYLRDGFEAEGEVSLLGAHVRGQLSCRGGKFRNASGPALNGDGVQVGQYMILRDGFEAEGEVNLLGAHVGGQLDCSGGKFRNAKGRALYGDGLQVDHYMFLRIGFEAEGEVTLLNARIGRNLECDGGKFRNAKGRALYGDGLEVAGDLFLRNGFEAEGEVNLLGARVGSWLDCGGGKFRNADGLALYGDGLQVDHYMFLRDGFEAEGEVSLVGAHIGGGLDCRGGKFRNANGRALTADGLRVEQGMFLRAGFEAEGRVTLVRAYIGGWLDCCGGEFSNQRRVALDLTDASVDHYRDDQANWPPSGGIRLSGLTYETIDATPRVSWRERLDWLGRDAKGYSPQPYEQLATAYRRAGEEDQAIRVEIAKRRRRRSQLNPLSRVLDVMLDVLVGYGYRTWQAFGWLAGLLAVGTASFWIAHTHALVRPVTKPLEQEDFDAFRYAADWIVPILNLHQREAWVTYGVAQWMTLGFAAAGWIVTTAVILGLSGVLKRD